MHQIGKNRDFVVYLFPYKTIGSLGVGLPVMFTAVNKTY